MLRELTALKYIGISFIILFDEINILNYRICQEKSGNEGRHRQSNPGVPFKVVYWGQRQEYRLLMIFE